MTMTLSRRSAIKTKIKFEKEFAYVKDLFERKE
jgi:hypothetical protein